MNKKTEGEIAFDVINESLYKNPMHLMLSWWKKNGYYTSYYISKD